jgi:hypothetical protein
MLKGDLQLSDIVESVDYIPLETNDNCLLKTISPYHFIVSENHILIKSQSTLYLFNRSGKFIAQIGRVGQGPGEYLEHHVFPLYMDEINQKIIIHTTYLNRLMYFDFKGKFIQSAPVHLEDGGIKIWIYNHILSMDGVQFQPDFTYKIYDSDFQPIVNRVRPLRLNQSEVRTLFNMPVGGPFSYYIFNDQIHTRESVLNDTLYMVDHKNFLFIPKYTLSVGKYAYSSDIIFGTNPQRFFDRSKGRICINSIFETKDFLFMRHNTSYCYYNKKQEQIFSLNSSSGIPNDYSGGLDFWPMYQKNNELIGFYDAYLFEENINKLKSKGTQKVIDQLKKLDKEIDPEDNPIMVVVKLKQ